MADFLIPNSSRTATGKTELFSRGEKQEEFKNGFQFRKLDKNPSCCPGLTHMMSFPSLCSKGFFLNFIAGVRLLLLKNCFNSDL